MSSNRRFGLLAIAAIVAIICGVILVTNLLEDEASTESALAGMGNTINSGVYQPQLTNVFMLRSNMSKHMSIGPIRNQSKEELTRNQSKEELKANVTVVTSTVATAVVAPSNPKVEAAVVVEPVGWKQLIPNLKLQNETTNENVVRAMQEWTGDKVIATVDGFIDGENIDVLEHFFWGQTNGIAMELGALDGTPATRSMTHVLEAHFGWKRVLVEGNPVYKTSLTQNSQSAFSFNSAVCEKETVVHFATAAYIGGILEFMGIDFLKSYHKTIFEKTVPPGNISSISDWSQFKGVSTVPCLPLTMLLTRAGVNHVNFFILDVEGGELSILKSIDFSLIKFDVLCIETTPTERPPNYGQQVTDYLAQFGYVNATGQVGRNIWFTRVGFVPSARPGISNSCFNGQHKSFLVDNNWTFRRNDPFIRC